MQHKNIDKSISTVGNACVFGENTNIVANLHHLWWIFHQASLEDNFTMHLGTLIIQTVSKSWMCTLTCKQFPAMNFG